MNGRIVFKILAGLVLLAAIVGIAIFAFNLGAAQHLQLPANSNGQVPYPNYGYRYWGLFPFFGLGCFGPLIALFLLFLALRAFSFLFWGPRWGQMHHGWHRGGWDESGVPPMFQEWHRRSHDEPETGKKE